MSARLTTSEFVERARRVHGDRYDYADVHYVNSHTKVKIVCSEHGPFLQVATSHLRGRGCPACGTIRAGRVPAGGCRPEVPPPLLREVAAARQQSADAAQAQRAAGARWRRVATQLRGLGLTNAEAAKIMGVGATRVQAMIRRQDEVDGA